MHIAITVGSGILFLLLFGIMFENWLFGIIAGLFFAVTNFIVFRPEGNKK
ncbi:hypothetical protein [Salinicoccus bachuensis]|uniref:Uncharacterized protein n=1 Tax=Salinicoccus bachuensis TaxID=3136731 RepID=A0ABZ3CIC0_9STAP